MQIKRLYNLIIITIIIGCNKSHSFEKVACFESDTSYVVFKPCRQIIYNAKFWDAESNLISESKVWMMATGKPWEMQPDRQMELIIQYEFDPAEKETINKSLINKGIEEWSWVRQTNTGIIENEGMFWMHPFRQNQYNFTEVAPFPGVRLPLEIGKTWTGNLNIGDGWGDWKNSTLSNIYQVVAFEEIDLSYGKMQAWHINSTTTAPFGVSTHNFWFNDELGFVKMIINSYAGQTLQFELIEVIEN